MGRRALSSLPVRAQTVTFRARVEVEHRLELVGRAAIRRHHLRGLAVDRHRRLVARPRLPRTWSAVIALREELSSVTRSESLLRLRPRRASTCDTGPPYWCRRDEHSLHARTDGHPVDHNGVQRWPPARTPMLRHRRAERRPIVRSIRNAIGAIANENKAIFTLETCKGSPPSVALYRRR